MEQPEAPPPGENEQIPTSHYVMQTLAELNVKLGNLQQTVNGIPNLVAESRRADLAELETRLTREIGDGDKQLIKWMVWVALTAVGLVIAALSYFSRPS